MRMPADVTRELKQQGRERRRNQPATSPSSSLETKRENIAFMVFREPEQQSMNHFNLRATRKLKFLTFHVHAPSRKIEKKNELKKKLEIREVKNPAAVFADVRVLVA